jgi:hypothetical protein
MAEDTPPFLDPTPPHWAANGLAYLLIAVVAIATVAAVVVQVPETVSSPFVLAPCSGSLLRQQVEALEALVNEGDLPSDLTCPGAKLQAVLTVPQSGTARVRPGRGVKLLYDAFPYGRYGIRYGTVRWSMANLYPCAPECAAPRRSFSANGPSSPTLSSRYAS